MGAYNMGLYAPVKKKGRVTMKKFAKLLAVCLAVMALAGCSLVTVNPEKITVATVGGETITKAQFDEEFNAFLSLYGYTQDSEEIADQLAELKESFIDQMVEDLVVDQKVRELGFDQITDEEKAEAEKGVDDWYQSQIEALVAEYEKDESVADPEAKAKEDIENYLSYYGTSLDDMKAQEIDAIPSGKLYDYVTKDIVVTEEEAKLTYAENVASDKEKYDGDLATFVSAFDNGYVIYYVPEGTFYVKHILIGLTDEQKQELKDLRADDDEAVAATADAKRDEFLATIQEEADAALAAVEAGGDFDALIAEYGDDPGMTYDYYADGYLTYVGNPSFVEEFTAACDALTEDGMTTGLVASDFGYHIIRRVATKAAGEVPFEDVKADLMDGMLSSAQSDAYDAQLDQWISEANVEIKSNKL